MPNQTDNFPKIKPSLLLDFGNSRRFDPRITVQRASSATFFDRLGILRTAPANEGRIGFDPATLECLGMMSEEQRTNLISNSTAVGVVPSTGAGDIGTKPNSWDSISGSNGITPQWMGVGTEDGIEYVDVRFSGTFTGASGSAYTTRLEQALLPASVGQTFAVSSFAKLVGGSMGGARFSVRLDYRDSNNVGLTTTTSADFLPTSSPIAQQRVTHTATVQLSNTTAIQPKWRISMINGETYDFTIRIGLPQLELGAHASSPIKTSGAQVTRAADAATLGGEAFTAFYNPTEGTIFVESQSLGDAVASTRAPHVFSLRGTNQNIVGVRSGYTAPTSRAVDVLTGGVTQTAINGGVFVAGNIEKRSISLKTNDLRFVVNGALLATDSSVALPQVTSLDIGHKGSGDTSTFYNGYIRKIAVYPKALTEAEQKALTA